MVKRLLAVIAAAVIVVVLLIIYFPLLLIGAAGYPIGTATLRATGTGSPTCRLDFDPAWGVSGNFGSMYNVDFTKISKFSASMKINVQAPGFADLVRVHVITKTQVDGTVYTLKEDIVEYGGDIQTSYSTGSLDVRPGTQTFVMLITLETLNYGFVECSNSYYLFVYSR